MQQKITPFLWFDDQAEEAAGFYTSLFDDSRITGMTHYGPEGSVMIVSFELAGQAFTALNGGPEFTFTPAISFYVSCESQAEVDRLWEALTSDGGEESMCGWLKDRYGLSWQIVPTALIELMQDEDAGKVQRVTQALYQMRKIDIAALQAAYDGVGVTG